jgi:hypothetical protein
MDDLQKLEQQRDALQDAIAQGDVDRAEGRESRHPWIVNRAALVELLSDVLSSIDEARGKNT